MTLPADSELPPALDRLLRVRRASRAAARGPTRLEALGLNIDSDLERRARPARRRAAAQRLSACREPTRVAPTARSRRSTGAPVWLNSEPLTAAGLRGRVVLVDFWTYSCVNWLRTLPYVRAWHERYRDRGLVVVGAHAPEFGFEHDLDNVRRAVGELDVGYPVVIDNDFAIWRSFDNHYWPAVYLVDRDGRVRFHHFGEEAYEETERAIQQLLGVDERARPRRRRRPGRGGRLGHAAVTGDVRRPRARRAPQRRRPTSSRSTRGRSPATGRWATRPRVLEAAGGSIAYRFQARDLNLVLAPPASGAPVRFAVRLDGRPPGDDHGLDADESGEGTVTEPRMYQLVRQRGPSASGRSRSRSSTRACARTSSPLAEMAEWAQDPP